MTEPTVIDVAAEAIGYDRPRDGLIGSGLSRMLAYQRASEILKALGLPLTLSADAVRRWGGGDVFDLGPPVPTDEIDRLRAELARITDQYHAQLEAVHDLTETLAEERVQHAAQMERVRVELAATASHLAEWMGVIGAVVPELEREMAPERPRLVGP